MASCTTATRSAPRIAVLIAQPTDRQRVLKAVASFGDAYNCRTAHELRVCTSGDGIAGIVCECRDAYGVQVAPALTSVGIEREIPILLFVRPTKSDTSCLCQLVRKGLPVIARITGQHDMAAEARSVLERRWSPEASAAILRSATELPSALEDVLVLAIIAGSQRVSVSSFANVMGVSERTLQRRLAAARMPPAVRLLAWATMVHSAWRLEILGERIKETAASVGFENREAFANFVRRHAGCAPSDLAREGAFARMVEQFVADLFSPQWHLNDLMAYGDVRLS